MVSPFANQIQNRNFLSTVGFEFTLAKYPKASFLCNSARIPEITLGTAIQPNYLKEIDVPGEILTYGDLILIFLVDENMEKLREQKLCEQVNKTTAVCDLIKSHQMECPYV